MPDAMGLSVALAARQPIPLDIAFEVAPGELLALVGPSGAGKSTVLRGIAGLHRVERGVVRCGGATLFDAGARRDLPPHRRAVGLVFQDHALFPHLTAVENVMAAMGRRPARERLARARDLLARVHLEGFEARRPAELSGGQQQRVAVARALARDPAVLLLDEPFSAVDRATRRRLQADLAELRRSLAIPILLVTHDLDEALALADRMVLIRQGRGLQEGPPGELLSRPASPEVARLLDLGNLFSGTIEAQDAATGRARLRWGPHALEVAGAPPLPPGAAVDWHIPQGAVVLLRPDRRQDGAPENAIAGVVATLRALAEEARVALDAGDPEGRLLDFTVPLHVARRIGLAPGAGARVSLRGEALHLMPRGHSA